MSAESGALASVPYNFAMRFESEKGTNPEELIAAAHAACFSMALSGQLGNAGMTAASIDRTPRTWERPSDHAPVVLELAN